MERTDMELIEQTLSGEHQSYDALMIRYQKLVFSIAFGICKTYENAMDITQDVFLKAYKKLDSFKGTSTFKTWISKISYNESINWQKKNSKYQDYEDSQDFELKIFKESNQEDEILAKENKAMLLRCLFELNTKYRLAVVLRYFENHSIKEIAVSMNCSEGVVKNMLFRSIQKLRKNLLAIQSGA
ncbi:RNA polymerase sigma factor [Calditrichota bacterium]